MTRWAVVSAVLFLVGILAASIAAPSVAATEIDATGVVYHVVDGDTFDVDTVGRVRLADIDAPEYGEPGYAQAKDFVNATVGDKDVYLDIDDVYGTDIYDRSVAVAYVRYNNTHLLNVNEALLEVHLAVVDDFPNEFDPSTWTLYVYSSVDGTPGSGSPQASGQSVLESPWFWVASGGIAVVAGSVATYVTMSRRRPER